MAAARKIVLKLSHSAAERLWVMKLARSFSWSGTEFENRRWLVMTDRSVIVVQCHLSKYRLTAEWEVFAGKRASNE